MVLSKGIGEKNGYVHVVAVLGWVDSDRGGSCRG